MIVIQIRQKEFDREMRMRFDRKARERLMTEGVNALAKKGERWIVKALKVRTGLSGSVIEEHVYFRSKSTGRGKAAAFAVSPTRRVSLRHLDTQRTARGLSFLNPPPRGRRKKVGRAWIAPEGGKLPGGVGFQRKGKARLPIRKPRGPALGLSNAEGDLLHSYLVEEWDKQVRRWMKETIRGG